MASDNTKDPSQSGKVEVPSSIMAMSNLRCPSPPPILNRSGASKVSFPIVQPVPNPDQPVRETIKAGGAYLNGKEKEKDVSNVNPKAKDSNLDSNVNNVSTNVGLLNFIDQQSISPETSAAAIGHTHFFNPSTESISSLDYTLSPPANPTHHKQPSMHAHFYVDETLKANKINRSRSGSNTSENFGTSKSGSVSSLAKSRENSTTSTGALSGVAASAAKSLNGRGEQNANIDPRLMLDDDKIHILFGVCGALSTLKIKLITSKLFEIYSPEKVRIQLILTKSSENFISQESLNILENVKGIKVWRDSDEWTTWKTRLDPVLHIELRRWADILVVCPLTANTLSKISLGLCDNLLTNVVRAWNTAKPILLAPAMVSYSYNAISTKRQIKSITEEMPWIEILKPVEKVFGSYGDIGMGGMMDWNEVVNKIVMKLGGYPEVEIDDKNEGAVVDDDDDNDDNDNDDNEEEDDDENDDDEDNDDEDDDDDEEENEENDAEYDANDTYNEFKVDIANLNLESNDGFMKEPQGSLEKETQ